MRSHVKALKRILIGLVSLTVLVALFYTEEDWRGKRAWERCTAELKSKGAVLDWSAYIPPPVPDDQNFFKAPRMAAWFVGKGATELSKQLSNPKTTPISDKDRIKTEAEAKDYLAWSDQFVPDFNLIQTALKRPYARMDGDYSVPYDVPIPNFITVRIVAQTLAQRAHCYLLLSEPEKALDELTLLDDSRHLLEGAPTGKPMTLVAAMINVAVTGLYVNTVADGFQRQVWQEPQLAALQKQLQHINLPPIVVQAFDSEPAATTRTLETISTAKLKEWFSPGGRISLWQKMKNLKWTLTPRGWIYQNMASSAKLVSKQTQGFDSVNNIIQPKKFGEVDHELNTIAQPYKFIAVESIPNFTKAWQTTARNQTLVDEAQIACALERYHHAHGEYPETLDTLTPRFIERLPHDIIGGQPSQGSGSASQPLHYRRTDNGKFLLYSVGWNETDDGGKVSDDRTKRDWVWQN